MPKPNVIVTGGAGYIGSHVCKALHRAGYQAVTFDDLSQGHRELVKWGPLEVVDICNYTATKKALEHYHPVAVVHCAGSISIEESNQHPERFYYNNVAGTLSLLRAMRETNVMKLVFSSSCAVHGTPKSVPIVETDLCAPENPYGRSKWLCEQIIEGMVNEAGLGAVILRYFNAAGADAEGDAGELHEPETHLIPLAIDALMRGTSCAVFGDDYPTEDGTAIRDFIHVSDLAQANVKAVDYLLESDAQCLRLNVGTGQGISVKSVLDVVERIGGKTLMRDIKPRRSGDVAVLVANSDRAAALLGFKTHYSDIETMVKTAYAWHRKQEKRKP